MLMFNLKSAFVKETKPHSSNWGVKHFFKKGFDQDYVQLRRSYHTAYRKSKHFLSEKKTTFHAEFKGLIEGDRRKER